MVTGSGSVAGWAVCRRSVGGGNEKGASGSAVVAASCGLLGAGLTSIVQLSDRRPEKGHLES